MTPVMLDIRNMGEGLECLSRLGSPKLPGDLFGVAVVPPSRG